MSKRNAVLKVGALALCLHLSMDAAVDAVATNLHVHAHAHNDYEHDRPLHDALDNRFYSVEADVWLVDGEILVAHDKGDWKGSLKELYLDPLKERVDRQGSVHGDGAEFLLWVDIKDSRPELRPVLYEQLQGYPMLTRFGGGESQPGPVTVILTGSAPSKEAFIEEYEDRPFCRDSNHYSPEDPPADEGWRWFALRWWSYMDWLGNEEISVEEKEKLRGIVEDIHSKGRKVRFYATPETELYWELALELGLDLINTDDLERLNEFLESKK